MNIMRFQQAKDGDGNIYVHLDTTESVYAELVAIKERLYKDIARLETLLGREKAIANMEQTMFNLGLVG